MEVQIITLIGAVAALLTGAISFLWGYWSEGRKRKEQAPSLEDRITALTGSLKSSLSVISEIETEIQKRSEIAEKLKDDVQRYEQLRELSQSQVEAIAQTIRGEIAGESRKSILIQATIAFGIAFVFFFLGLWMGRI